MAPLFEHYGVQLWMPEVSSRADPGAEDREQTMPALEYQSKREIARGRKSTPRSTPGTQSALRRWELDESRKSALSA